MSWQDWQPNDEIWNRAEAQGAGVVGFLCAGAGPMALLAIQRILGPLAGEGGVRSSHIEGARIGRGLDS
jgi:hypothetical protein